MFYVGVDIGGTSFKGGIVNSDGKLLFSFKFPVNKNNKPEETINQIVNAIKQLLKDNNFRKEDIVGVGIGAPGMVDSVNGVITFAGNLNWYDLPVKKLLEEGLNLPVRVTNDASAAALAEAKFGAGRKYNSFLMVTLGTGVGSGIVINGKLYEGNFGKGAEFGHSLLVMNGRECGCGRKGCLEAYVSATALTKDIEKMMNMHPDSIMWDISKEHGLIDAKVAFIAAQRGDKYALDLVDAYVSHLSEGLLSYFNTFRPEAVILSGGVAEAGEYLISKIKDYCQKQHYGLKFAPPVDIVKAAIGYDSGKIGAAALFME